MMGHNHCAIMRLLPLIFILFELSTPVCSYFGFESRLPDDAGDFIEESGGPQFDLPRFHTWGRSDDRWKRPAPPNTKSADDPDTPSSVSGFPHLMSLLKRMSSQLPDTYAENIKREMKSFKREDNLDEIAAVGSRGGTSTSVDAGANFDDVVDSQAVKSKRGREYLQRAMPPTNELCRLMHVQCY